MQLTANDNTVYNCIWLDTEGTVGSGEGAQQMKDPSSNRLTVLGALLLGGAMTLRATCLGTTAQKECQA
jgi:hypothetical protein